MFRFNKYETKEVRSSGPDPPASGPNPPARFGGPQSVVPRQPGGGLSKNFPIFIFFTQTFIYLFVPGLVLKFPTFLRISPKQHRGLNGREHTDKMN